MPIAMASAGSSELHDQWRANRVTPAEALSHQAYVVVSC